MSSSRKSNSRNKHAPTAHARGRRKKRAWDRHPEDWYIEPAWVNDGLFSAEQFEGRVYDPACGIGRIVAAARRAGLKANGCDVIKRAPGFKVGDFFEQSRKVDNICCNIPFRFAMAFIGHAINLVERKAAILIPAAWIHAEGRSRWLARMPLRQIWLITPRPSMPPGTVVVNAEHKISNGTTDFAWIVFEHGYTDRPNIGWIRRGDVEAATLQKGKT